MGSDAARVSMSDGSPPSFVLEDSVPYLAARVGKLIEEVFQPQLSEVGLTIEMWRVLIVLSQQGSKNLVELSAATSVKPPTLSRLVGRMIALRLISRNRSKQDSRTVEVTILKAGETMVARLLPRAAEIQRIVTEPFTDADVIRLKAALRQIYDVLEVSIHSGKRDRTE